MQSNNHLEVMEVEAEEIPLEKVIETRLVQSNVTEQVLAELKEKYGGLKLKAIDDKESYLELKSAAKDCAKVRNLATKVCKQGREDSVKIQKMWVAEEKRVISRVIEVESKLDAEIALFDAEVNRKEAEEKERQESAYINRQQTLTKMGAKYMDGSFVLGEASYEANLIKSSSDDVWEEAIVPNFTVEYEKIESVRIEEQKIKDEAAKEMKRHQEELLKQQEELRVAKAEIERQKQESEKIAMEKEHADQLEKERIQHDLQTKRFNKIFPFNPSGEGMNMNSLWVLSESDFEEKLAAKKEEFEKVQAEKKAELEEKMLKDIEDAKLLAIKQEKERIAVEEVKRQSALEAAKDKYKWEAFISKVKELETFEMRSGQYRKKMQIAKEKIEEILSL